MIKRLQRFRFVLIAGMLAVLLTTLTAVNSAAQKDNYRDPQTPYKRDVVAGGKASRMLMPAMGCYTVIVLGCPAGFERVHCQFNGVYGPPYNCTWTSCFINYGERHCVLATAS